MSTLAIRTMTVNEAIAAMLRPFPVKVIARKIETSARTVENWREGRTGPQIKHVAAMLQDPDLGPALLSALGRQDLAAHAEILSLNQRIETLKAAEQQHHREANEIRRDLEMGGRSVPLAGGQVQQRGGEIPPRGRVVPRSTD